MGDRGGEELPHLVGENANPLVSFRGERGSDCAIASFRERGHPSSQHTSARSGRSCPDCELKDGTRLGALLRDGRGLLLEFGGQASLQRSMASGTTG
jgi:hypothetical protein